MLCFDYYISLYLYITAQHNSCYNGYKRKIYISLDRKYFFIVLFIFHKHDGKKNFLYSLLYLVSMVIFVKLK